MTDGRTREARQEKLQTTRRRRGDNAFQTAQNMPIPAEIAARLKAEGRTPRWANDVGNRIHRLTVEDDYDKVDGVAPVPVVIDRKSGETVMAHLLSKPTDFIAEDRAKAESRRKEAERAMVKGQVAQPGVDPVPVQGQLGAPTYVDSASNIGRGNQIIE